MLLWNYEFLPPLEPLLVLPSPSVAVAAASLTSAIIVVVDVVVHRVPILQLEGRHSSGSPGYCRSQRGQRS